MNGNDLITVDPGILGGTPVFKGTRVPVKTLFDYLENNYSLDEFVECFPSVTREMGRRLLERSASALLSPAASSADEMFRISESRLSFFNSRPGAEEQRLREKCDVLFEL